jgi:hypothetical protein
LPKVVSGNVADVTDDGDIRSLDSLPGLPGNGIQHAWDVCGRGDNLGTLSRLAGTAVVAGLLRADRVDGQLFSFGDLAAARARGGMSSFWCPCRST